MPTAVEKCKKKSINVWVITPHIALIHNDSIASETLNVYPKFLFSVESQWPKQCFAHLPLELATNWDLKHHKHK